MRVFVTGTAGFIGFNLARRLLADGHDVLGFDGLTPYYDVAIKRARHRELKASPRFSAVEAMLEDKAALQRAFKAFGPDIVVHLAAQAGVRYSLEQPDEYINSNVAGTLNLLECARADRPRHFLMASSSSVYGANQQAPFREVDRTDFPVSLYGATKKAGEALAHSYAHLFDIPVTCFRFFTVYGPGGRPDMAPYRFVAAIEAGRPIEVYGQGRMRRDFTYIDDLVEAVCRLIKLPPDKGKPVVAAGVIDSLSPVAPWRAINIAQGAPVGLLRFIEVIEDALGKKAIRLMRPMQPGDVVETWADAGLLRALTGYVPDTKLEAGMPAFVSWYRHQQESSSSAA